MTLINFVLGVFTTLSADELYSAIATQGKVMLTGQAETGIRSVIVIMNETAMTCWL
jgi:hypothetical protein